MELARAVAVASLLGVFKVGGRVIDLLGGNRWDGLSTGIVSGAMIPIGLAVMWIGGQGILSVAGFRDLRRRERGFRCCPSDNAARLL